MSRSRILSSIAAASLGIALLGACSAESLTERAVGFGLEQAAGGDQDIDLDFGDDGLGGFSVKTDEGDFSLNFDEDSGGILFDTEDGAGAISFDEDGIVFNTDEGDGVIGFDEENGAITFETDEGDGVINFDEETGTVGFEGDAGSAVFGGNEIPDAWPAAIGVPQTADPAQTTFSVIDFDGGLILTANFQHGPEEFFAAKAQSYFENQGWTVKVETAEAGGSYTALNKGESSVIINNDGNGSTLIMINEIGG